MRRKFKWTTKQIDKLNKVREILVELEEFHPLTLRQIYYQLVGKAFIENNTSQYTMLSQLLKHARIDGIIDWNCIEDRVRSFVDLRGWDNSGEYIDASIKAFLNNYRRDLMKTQDIYLEIWIEKDALSSIFKRVALPYTIPVVVCRGFSSVSFLNDYRDRLKYMSHKKPVLLYFGDFDPSGVEMLEAMKKTMLDELKIPYVEFKRVSLLIDDIIQYRLPHSPDALKKSDTRAKKHVKEFGELAVELDALSPAVLQQKIEMAILNEIDIEKFRIEEDEERIELNKLKNIKDRVKAMVIDNNNK